MKIGIVTPYRNYYGGVENFNKNLDKILLKAGHEVQYITIDGNEKKYNSILTKILGEPYITYKEFKKCKSKFDVVICNGEFGLGINHSKCINIFHGSYYGILMNSPSNLSLRDKLHLYRLSFIQKISSKGKYVVSVSEYLEDILIKSGIKVDQIINNSIDINKFKPSGKDRKLDRCIFVGSYNYYFKGFNILEKLAINGIDITCVTNKKVDSPLKFIPNTDNELMNSIYNKYKILLFPSVFESFGYVPLEALACGLPIIMHDVGIGKEIMELEPDFIIKINSEDIVQQYMERIVKINGNYGFYSEKARKLAEDRYGFNIFAEKWIKLVEDINENKL